MSHAQTDRSPDLGRLVEEGYSVALTDGCLVLRHIPYVDADRRVRTGTLVFPLRLAGGATCRPDHHGAHWAGSTPCDHSGRPLALGEVVLATSHGNGISTERTLCHKPLGREFHDYHELASSYAILLASHARRIDPSATPRPRHGATPAESGHSTFAYADTATARAGLGALAGRLAGESVAIIGLGGTGGYVLDLVSKCPVGTIHLFDDDVFLQHNAFRAPGAASSGDVSARRAKVEHFAAIYSRMHRSILPHRVRLGPGNLSLIDRCDFAFLCIDEGAAKPPIVARLEAAGTAFVDVGMGLVATDAGILGSVRVTTSAPGPREHVRKSDRIPFATGEEERDVYGTNVQVADLNALNATLAVIRWKRLRGFYADHAAEHHAVFDIAGNVLLNADRAETT